MPSRHFLRCATAAFALALLIGCAHGSSGTGAAPAPSMTVALLPAGVTSAMVATGDSIFHTASCQRCHGMDARGTPRGPDLTDTTWSQIDGSYAQVVQLVTTGVPKAKVKLAGAPFGMNPRGGTKLSDEQIRDVSAYVYSLSHH